MAEAMKCPVCGGDEGCKSHFKQLQPSIKECKISKHFDRDIENSEEIIKNILSCEHSCFTELHKFEKKIKDISVFRAKIDSVHIVYAIQEDEKKKGEKAIFFLRALKNFREYTKFLEDEKEIKNMISSLNVQSTRQINK